MRVLFWKNSEFLNSTLHGTSYMSEVYTSCSLERHMVSYKRYDSQESEAQGIGAPLSRDRMSKGPKSIECMGNNIDGSIIEGLRSTMCVYGSVA